MKPSRAITSAQRKLIAEALREGLSNFQRPIPLTAVEWADKHFYCSAESSYLEGKWETVPFQVAILNAMGNDEIEEVNVQKAARMGYTKMAVAAVGYHAEHKKRNQILWAPTDDDATGYMQDHIDPMIRDVAPVRAIAPWCDKKSTLNTTSKKGFSNHKRLFVKGGKAARNYREKSVDVVYFEELTGFDEDIEGEGSPTSLGDVRIAGSIFPKSIRGSTPGVKDECQIEAAVSDPMERYVPCPHCDKAQVLKFGGRDSDYGLKWDDGDPDTVMYECEFCHALFGYECIAEIDAKGYYESESGLRTYDGIDFFRDGEPVPTPKKVSFLIWRAYSYWFTWAQIIDKWLGAQSDPEKLKTFVNTILGETWEDKASQSIDWQTLKNRREHYCGIASKIVVPDDVLVLFAGIDTQDDRFEFEILGIGPDEESWSIDYQILFGNLSMPQIWERLREKIFTEYVRRDGTRMSVHTALIDSGGHYTSEVYGFSKKCGILRVMPSKGQNTPGNPIAVISTTTKGKTKKDKAGVYLVHIGTDNAKDLVYHRNMIEVPGPGFCHWPMAEQYGDSYFRGLTAEKKKPIRYRGKRTTQWVLPGHRRNEPLDCRVMALAALRTAQKYKGLDLENIHGGPKRKQRRVHSQAYKMRA